MNELGGGKLRIGHEGTGAPARRRGATIKDVAALAGVSPQTVSRVINHGPNVREEARARVLAAVDALDYVPSIAARRMGGAKSYLLLALNDRDRTIADWRSGEGKDWVDQMLLGGMLKCAEYGYRLIFELVDTHSEQVEREIIGVIAALHPDGIILTPPHSDNDTIVQLLIREGIPFARIGSSDTRAGFAVTMDDEHAAEVATERLLTLGHRRIGFIAGSVEYALSRARVEGYRRAMSKAGVPVRPHFVQQGDFTFESGLTAARSLLDCQEPVTAIVASNDQMAVAVLEVARQLGIIVPAELSVISFDDTPMARFSTPPLTAINQPIAAMTAAAAEFLIGANSSAQPPDGVTIVPFKLVERQSTAVCER